MSSPRSLTVLAMSSLWSLPVLAMSLPMSPHLHVLHPTLHLLIPCVPPCPQTLPNVPSCPFSTECWTVWGPGRACGVTKGALGDPGLSLGVSGLSRGSLGCPWGSLGCPGGVSGVGSRKLWGALRDQEPLQAGVGLSRGGCGTNPG